MDKILIIANPTSGGKKGSDFGDEVRDIFTNKQFETKLYETDGEDDFKQLVEDALEDGFTKVVLIGGDGTVSEFVNQISSLTKRPQILLLPLGTTNNFARALGSELDDQQLLSMIEADALTEKEVDVGKINDRYFISTVSVGSIPAVAWETDDDLKENIGSLAYVLEGARIISDETTDFDVRIKMDGNTLEEDEVFLVVIGLSNSVFGIETFFEEATVNDGKLHLYILRKTSILTEAGALLKQIVADKQENKDDFSYTGTFEQAEINSSADMNFSVDGEKGPDFPIKLKVLHNHLTFLVPEEDK